MPPPPSPPSVNQLLGINSFHAEASSIPPSGDFRGQPTAPLPMGSLSGAAATAIDECNLLARLDQKRREIEAEIEAFKAEKEDEYRRFEWKLKEEQKLQSAYKSRKCENGRADARDTTHVAAGVTMSSDGDGSFTRDQVVNTGAQIPLDLGGSKLNDTLKLELPDNRKQSGFDGSSASSSATTSPPFEKELQAAGLFTPRYLPLLDNNYFRQSPPLQDLGSEQTSPQMPKLATIPGPSSRTGNTSPAYPLASSLKSSSGSSTGTLSKSGAIKQKSPKRVTFRFEDENSVPSRSSPPSTKVHWTLEDENDPFDDDGFVEYEGEDVEEVDEDEFDETGGKVEQVENITEGLGVSVGERFIGDELVVPMNLGGGRDTGGSITQDSDTFNGLGIRGVSGGLDRMNGNKAGSGSTDDGNNGFDDDDEALFDLDETIPEVLDNSPPQRDYSALLDSQQPHTHDRLTASKFPMLPSFTPAFPPIPVSASESLLTFGKSPGPRLGLPRTGARRGSISSSLSLSPFLNQNKFEEEPIASSLPNFGWKGIDPPKTGFVPTPGGRFRRRSIVKYDLPEDTTSSKGKGKETARAIDEEEDEEEDLTLMLSRSPNATSLPMSISRHSPAAFMAKSGSKSPKLPPQPANHTDAADSTPVPGRPSPKPRGSPISETVQVYIPPQSPKVDSADILASMPTSPPKPEGGSLEKNDSVSSYRRSSPFPSTYDRTPYHTAYAAEVAAAAALDDEANYGGVMESVVGGVDGRTGLDPDLSSYRPSSVGNRVRRGSIVGGSENIGGGLEAMDPGQMSFGMRMAFESVKERGGR